MTFAKEPILPASDNRSPFYINIPNHDSKPIDQLVSYFKFWKIFIKSFIYYCKELGMIKEFDANINFQLINSVQFPGFKNLPSKYVQLIEDQQKQYHSFLNNNSSSPNNSGSNTPKNELKKTLSNNSLNELSDVKRPVLFKTKSNQSFLKKNDQEQSSNSHKRNVSITSLAKHSPSNSESGNHLDDVFVPNNFFSEFSLFNNLAPSLINHHYQIYQAQIKFHRELATKLLPRLESLLKNLSNKIKEIKSTLKNDSFANTQLIKEISKSGKVLHAYMQSVETYSSNKPVLKNTDEIYDEDEGVLDDPFLLKLQVDYQLKNQLIHENYMFASYVNLQNISKELLSYVLKELNIVIDRLGKLINQESIYSNSSSSDVMAINLYNILKKTVPHGANPNNDWEFFISNNPHLLNTFKPTDSSPKKEIRNFGSLTLPYANSIHNKCLRFGIMYKKLKILKNYNSYYYVLSCNYLHEFKFDRESPANTPNTPENNATSLKKNRKDKIGGFIGHDDIPIKSYNLNEYQIKIKDGKNFKFILTKNSNKFTFKCNNEIDYNNWYGDLFELLKFGSNHLERFELVQSKVSQREDEMAKRKELKKQQKLQQVQTPNTKFQSNNSVTNQPTQISRPSSPRLSDKSHELRINLNNLLPRKQPIQSQQASNGEESLSGIFTPRIHTPNGSGSEEGNPFENTFSYQLPSNTSSPQMSPNLTGSQPSLSIQTNNSNLPNPPALIATSPAGTSGAVELPHQVEHENYLKMQQEVLKQQQDILNLKINQVESGKQSPQFKNEDRFTTSPPSIKQLLKQNHHHHHHHHRKASNNSDLALSNSSRASSNDSISSMIHQSSSNMQKIINNNQGLINNDNIRSSPSGATFLLNNDSDTGLHNTDNQVQDSDSNNSSRSQSYGEVPKVTVSPDS